MISAQVIGRRISHSQVSLVSKELIDAVNSLERGGFIGGEDKISVYGRGVFQDERGKECGECTGASGHWSE